MMDDDTYATLNDYFDGLLSGAERRAFEAQVAADPELQAELAAMRALRAEASTLPRGLEPDRDLWDGIAARIGATKQETDSNVVSFDRRDHGARRISVWGYYTAAAAMLLMLLGGQYMLAHRPVPPASQGGGIASNIPSADEIKPELDEFKRIASQYLDARKQLVDVLEARRDDIPPETLAVVEENLTVIASAVSDIEVALAKNPRSPKLERMLYTAYRNEVGLLQQAVQLADESAASNDADDSKGDGNAA